MSKESELTEAFMLFDKSTLAKMVIELTKQAKGKNMLQSILEDQNTKLAGISLERLCYRDALKNIRCRTSDKANATAKEALDKYEPKVAEPVKTGCVHEIGVGNSTMTDLMNGEYRCEFCTHTDTVELQQVEPKVAESPNVCMCIEGGASRYNHGDGDRCANCGLHVVVAL